MKKITRKIIKGFAYFKKNNPIEFKKFQSEMGKRGGKIGGIASSKKQKKNKTGFYDIKLQKKIHEKLKKENKSFYNLKNQSKFGKERVKKYGGWSAITKEDRIKNGRQGGLSVQRVLRINIRNLKFKNKYYDSKLEIEISICLQKQFNYNPKENRTLHIRIGKYEYDYLLKDLMLFIEFHPWFNKITEKQYYNKRRKNLNKNGFKDYNLMVIK